MQIIFIIVGLLASFYLFFYISGLIIINNTKKIGEEMGCAKEKEVDYQVAISEWCNQNEQPTQRDNGM